MAESSKLCSKCKKSLPVSAFWKDRSQKDGKCRRCKGCASAQSKEWESTQDRKEYHKIQNNKRKDAGHVWYVNNKQKVSTTQKAYGQRMKKETINKYGGCCTCCGENNLVFLTMDHINNDGAKHRRSKEGPRGPGIGTYVWLRDNEYPNTLQVLCFNCNWAKSHGGCPHQNTSNTETTQS